MTATFSTVMGILSLKTLLNRCDSLCAVETGYYCIHTATSSVCDEKCGDGLNMINVRLKV
jgi:hypothetical protein